MSKGSTLLLFAKVSIDNPVGAGASPTLARKSSNSFDGFKNVSLASFLILFHL